MALILRGSIGDNEITHPITDGRHTIGRSSRCAIQVPYPFVSREHAEIVADADRVLIRDLGSHNGTWVNGIRIDRTLPLTVGDRITIADVTLWVTTTEAGEEAYVSDGSTVETRKQVSWDEVRAFDARAVDKKTRLYQVLAEAGELLAVQRPLEELFGAILNLVETTVASERSFVLLNEEGKAEPVIRASRLHGPRREGRIVLSQTMIQKVLHDKASFLTSDAQQDPRFQSHESVILQRTRSAMAAPLFDNERVIGILYADTTDPVTQYSDDELRTFTILANLIAVKITQARLEAAEAAKRQLEMELQTARDILKRILPEKLAEVDGYELCAFQEPCYTVGGDLYDVLRLPDGRLVILMGDVAGKGLGAALIVSTIMPIVQLFAEEFPEPIRVMSRLNRQLWRSTDRIRFATVFLGILDPGTGRLEYVNAGHNPPLLIDRDGSTREVPATGLPVGMFEDASYEAGTVSVRPGELLMLYSDGVPEAQDASGDEYGMTRFQELLCRERGRRVSGIVECVTGNLREFMSGCMPTDDVTMLAIRRL